MPMTEYDLNRLKRAPDLHTSYEYGDTETGKPLVAITYSSALLGMTYRESFLPKVQQENISPSEAKNESDSSLEAENEPKSKRRK
jgi:hypothetical protein